MNVSTLHRPRRIAPGRYEVPSETIAGQAYSVQVEGDRGDCNCIGAERAHSSGRTCKHIRECIAEERKHMNENGNAVAVREPDLPVVQYNPTLPTIDEMKVMVTISNSVYKTSGKLIPSSIKTSEEAFAVMLAGREYGLGPMESFREVYVVQGTTVPSYRLLLAMVMRGDPTARVKWLERSEKRACAQFSREGRETIEVEYTMAMAERAGNAGKDNYKKHPTDMLCARVVTRICKLGGPDLIMNIGASVRHAPAVMRAIDEAIDADADEIPALEQSAEPEPTPRDNLRALLARWREEGHPNFANIVKGVNLARKGTLTDTGDYPIGGNGLTDEEAQDILDKLTAIDAPQQEALIP